MILTTVSNAMVVVMVMAILVANAMAKEKKLEEQVAIDVCGSCRKKVYRIKKKVV
jgi:hypothetical protein